MPNAKYQQGNQNLAGIWQQAESTGGLVIPFAGVAFLDASRQAYANNVERLEITVDRALSRGDVVQAQVAMQQLSQLDPANAKAKGLKNRVGKLMIQTVAQVEEAPAGEAAPAAPEAPAAEAPPPKRPPRRNSRAVISRSICLRSPRKKLAATLGLRSSVNS